MSAKPPEGSPIFLRDGHDDLWAVAAILGREIKSAQASKENVT